MSFASRVRLLLLAAALVITPLALAACEPADNGPAADLPGDGITVTAATDSVIEGFFQTEVVLIGLERLGYTSAPMLNLEVPSMHVVVGEGDADFTAIHWDPLQTIFFTQAGGPDGVRRVGVLVEGALQGYLIDKATADQYNITNLDDFRDPEIAARFDTTGDGRANLTGCNPGWGCELVIEHHLDEFDLRDHISHDQGAYFALLADTMARFDVGQPIFYYTWTPQWVGNVLVPDEDVVWLEVPFSSHPEGIDTVLPDGRDFGFGVEQIRVVANAEFLDANPAAERFFELAEIPIEDINAQNLRIHEGEDTEADVRRHAEEWVEENQALFDSWIEQALAAAE